MERGPVRYQGTLSEWNDARGYGFIVPNGGGERAFVHIKSLTSGRRPHAGDQLVYEIQRDPHGRLNAVRVRYPSAPVAPPASSTGRTQAAVPGVILYMLGLTAWAGFGGLPVAVLAAYAGMSLLSYAMYAADKRAARQSARRIPEQTLHTLDLLCGWPGGWLAQHRLRHKTVKPAFRSVFWLTVAGNVSALLAWQLGVLPLG